jgi:hypothetical protein
VLGQSQAAQVAAVPTATEAAAALASPLYVGDADMYEVLDWLLSPDEGVE